MSRDDSSAPPFLFVEQAAAESPDQISPALEFDCDQLGELAEWLTKNIDDSSLVDFPFSSCPHPGSASGSVPDQGQGNSSYDNSVPQQSGQAPMTALPVSTLYPGPYQFQLEFGKQPKETKSAAWTFSPSLNKLYAQKDAMCPVRFRLDSAMGANLFIRALPIFLRHEFVQEIVRRCPNHVQAPENANVRHKEHFVWCEHPGAQYLNGGSAAAAGRLSVVVPVDQPPAGTPWITYLYSFKCLNSCVGGPNRREMAMIFTLENQAGDILGRQSFDLRICACPGRDRKTDEGKLEPAASASGSNVSLMLPSPQSPDGSPSSGAAAAYLQQQAINVGPQAGPSGASSAGSSAPARRGIPATEASEATVAKRSRVADDDDDDDDDEVYNVYVTGRSNFELLCQIRDSLELADRVRSSDRQQYLQLRQYSDGPVVVAANAGGASTDRSRTSFTFSCESNPVKSEVVDSTQPGSASGAGGIDMTDSADVTSTCADEQGATVTIAAWLHSIGFDCYLERLQSLGLATMEELVRNIRSLDLESLGIPQPHRGHLWRHLLRYRLHISKRRLVVVPSPGGATVTLAPSTAASGGGTSGFSRVVLSLGPNASSGASTSGFPPVVLRLGSLPSSAADVLQAAAPEDGAPPSDDNI